MTQPPLSRQIQKLERSIGVQLLERDNRRVELTGAGSAFLDEAYRLLNLVDTAGDLARRVDAGAAGVVRLGFTAVSSNVFRSVTSWFGAHVTAGGTGVLLNNEMDDFTAKEGAPNMYGLVQGEPNRIEPGKRPLSSMTPTIVTRDSKPLMLLARRVAAASRLRCCSRFSMFSTMAWTFSRQSTHRAFISNGYQQRLLSKTTP